MKLRILCIAVCVLAASLAGCSQPEPKSVKPTGNVSKTWKEVVAEHGKVTAGMSTDQVEGILGRPSEVKPQFDPDSKSPVQIGTSWLYYENPSRDDEWNGNRVIVRFDLEAKVTEVNRMKAKASGS